MFGVIILFVNQNEFKSLLFYNHNTNPSFYLTQKRSNNDTITVLVYLIMGKGEF